MVPRLGEVLWIVDLNRQSLDRVVPDIAAGRIGRMFEAAGWQTITVKYGRRLRELFARAGRRGAAAAHRRDEQRGVPAAAAHARPPSCASASPATGPSAATSSGCSPTSTTPRSAAAIRDLGGHDLADLLDAFAQADAATDRPSVVFAYTIKAWSLPTQGHPANHSALLSPAQWRSSPASSAPTRTTRGRASRTGRPRRSCAARPRARLERPERAAARAARRRPPTSGARTRAAPRPSRRSGASSSTSAHERRSVAEHVVTVSPDVASSTNLGGWINRAGIFSIGERVDWFADDPDTLIHWRETEHGQHIELGIAEGNLVGVLGELGATWSRDGAAAAADRHDLRPVRHPRARAVVVRHVRGRPVDPRRHAVGRDARARGRRAPVDHHAVDRARAAALRGLGARVRPGPRVDAAARALAARARRTAARRTSACRRGRSTRRSRGVPEDAAGREARRRAALRGGYRLREAARPPQRDDRRHRA